MRCLVSGGSGFIAAHVIEALLKNKHSVVFTVRSDEKGQKILSNHPNSPKDQLSYVIVKDIAQPCAFDEAVKSDPPFEAVLHTASPFHFNVTDPKKDLLDPAINGTNGILAAIKKSAPSVKRVAITSSFASIINPSNHAKVYSEKVWNPITMEEAVQDPASAYRASKKFAEEAAWKFVETEKPNFTLTTICPPLVLGPVVHYFSSLESLNTSNELVRDLIQGKFAKDGLPATRVPLFVDVRDLADAHVQAVEREQAQGKRFFVTAGFFRNGDVADIVKKNFPEYEKKLPGSWEYVPKDFGFDVDNSRGKEVLGLKYRRLEDSIVDLVKSLQAAGA
ncbi:putative NADPH-dependent methylglyoxal GRP2 [Cyphellophora attinorum]|uniref:Putative NADPH-dependent methylglyoxal GRP2 n=1 Tax=Cyphellophora attinorum TaxID=1664694 RepID=A0A0N0NLS5_9EURO|nr:putative NADPH-dependent methylglyoxal GRP2 [Phialophora attinorum]KPI39641.1 putative NADPH-dependent methylglyoxal GRP2 [Phialophora attinorum]